MKTSAAILLPLLLAACPAHAFDFGEESEEPTVELHGELSNLLLWRNDADFDRTVPYYGEEGQSVGAVTSFFKPDITLRPTPSIELFYEGELGLNFLSRNNPDQWYPAADDFMVYKHREIWSRVQVDFVDLKAGYQRVRDPSDLFLSHWMGALSLGVDLMRIRARALIGQLPDSTYEGVDVRRNNFIHDNLTTGLSLSYDLIMEELTLDAGAYFVYDTRVVRKPLFLAVPYAGLSFKTEDFRARLYGLLQAGAWDNSGVGGINQEILAWAATAGIGMTFGPIDLGFNTFALSADDEYDGNGHMGAFLYSGKNSSPTLLLTEDEIRDRYDNLDEQMGGPWGGFSFFRNRAGLSVTDVTVTGAVTDWLSAQLVGGVGIVLAPDNAAGNRYAGFETDLVIRFRLVRHAWLVAAGQLVLPGRAAAAFTHTNNMEETSQIHGFQFGTLVNF